MQTEPHCLETKSAETAVAVDDFPRIAAGHDPIAQRLHGGRRVDIRHRLEIVALRAQMLLIFREMIGGTTFGDYYSPFGDPRLRDYWVSLKKAF